jgi:hypothetical protein
MLRRVKRAHQERYGSPRLRSLADSLSKQYATLGDPVNTGRSLSLIPITAKMIRPQGVNGDYNEIVWLRPV